MLKGLLAPDQAVHNYQAMFDADLATCRPSWTISPLR